MAIRLAVSRAAFWTVAVLTPLAASAQLQPPHPQAGDGFMFGAPRGSITVRAGYAQPSERSDIYSFVRKELTLDRGDFASGSGSVDLSLFVQPRLAVQFGLGYSSRSVPSSYRSWVDNNDQEIEQTSVLSRMPLTMGLRYYLTPPGRSIGRLAWVPARVAVYAAGGVGITWYQFRQTGDFVDYQSQALDVFHSTLESNHSAPSAYGALGVDYALNAMLALTGEARYDAASAAMSRDFSGFNRIDLSGTAVTVGLTVRF